MGQGEGEKGRIGNEDVGRDDGEDGGEYGQGEHVVRVGDEGDGEKRSGGREEV